MRWAYPDLPGCAAFPFFSALPTMSIVVFHLHNAQPAAEAPVWVPQCHAYSDSAMTQALAQCQSLRADPRNAHVCISSNLSEMVGTLGVAAVENGRPPDGEPYDWSKAGRAGAVRRR